mgnify:CR=1 FL=1
MRVTINTARQVLYFNGHAHALSRAGCNRLFVWLMDHGALLWGWDSGEYVFHVEVTP